MVFEEVFTKVGGLLMKIGPPGRETLGKIEKMDEKSEGK